MAVSIDSIAVSMRAWVAGSVFGVPCRNMPAANSRWMTTSWMSAAMR